MEHPGLFGFLPLTDEDWKDLPDPKTPYYILAGDGIFYHRTLLIGEALTPLKKMPAHLKDVGMSQGAFLFTAEPIPAAICAQAVSFFRRIYERHKTEAEVYVTRHHQTGAYRLFIPNQTCTGASVHSQFDPTHISRGWQLVGTMHSHCMMSAFHSGTDTNDASTLDGIHITVGKVMNDTPDIAAMVSVDGHYFTYKPEQLADFSDLTAGTAPDWWDRYVTKALPPPTNIRPFKGYTAQPSRWTPPPQNRHWAKSPAAESATAWWDDIDGYAFYADGFYDRLIETTKKNAPEPEPVKVEEVADHALYDGTIPDDVADVFLSSGVITDADLDESVDFDMDEWAALFVQKLEDAANVLRYIGFDVGYYVEPAKPAEETEPVALLPATLPGQLPGQLIAFEELP